jgi:hypothetical protein
VSETSRQLLSRAALPVLRSGDRALDRLVDAVGDASRTVKFLRGRASFDARADDVYVASYPRSGTTWTQVIAYLIVSGETDFHFRHLAEVSPWWERNLAHRSDATAELRAMPGPRVLKTHLPYRWLPSGARYLYVWRNAEDVAVSYYYLYRRYLDFDGPFAEFFERFLRGDVQYKSWFRHVAGWEAHQDDPRVLFIPYDEMRSQTRSWVRRIAEFLDVELSEERCEAIVRQTDFGSMKAAEDKFDFANELLLQRSVRDGAFLRAGKVSRGEGHLTAEQRDSLERARARHVPLPAVEWRLPAFLH